MKMSWTKLFIALLVGGFIVPAIIINSLQFLGFAVVWTFWSHLFVYFDLLIFAAIIQSCTRLVMQELIDAYIKITTNAIGTQINANKN